MKDDEYIKYLSHMLDEAMDEKDIGDNVPKRDVEAFVDGMLGEVSESMNEGEEEDIARMKAEIFDFIGKMKTKEDLEAFIRNNKAAIEGLKKNQSIPQKIKKYLLKIWDVLCCIVKFGLFCVRNITSIAILAAVIFVCVKFEITPAEAITKAYQAAKVVYTAADMTLTGAKKATDTYSSIRDKSSDIGWKVGEKVGKVIGNWL